MNHWRIPSIVLALAVSAAGAAAHAQDAPTGSLLSRGGQGAPVNGTGNRSNGNQELIPFGSARALMVARSTATCMVRDHDAEVRKYLAGPIAGNPLPENSVLRPNDVAQCVYEHTGDLEALMFQIGGRDFSGMLAEAWLRQNNWTTPPAQPSASVSYNSSWMGGQGRDNTIVDEMGACVAATQPEAARALVVSPPGSKAEAAAMKAVFPGLPTCFAKDAQLRIDKTGLRLTLALGLYHRVVDPGVMPAAAVNEKN